MVSAASGVLQPKTMDNKNPMCVKMNGTHSVDKCRKSYNTDCFRRRSFLAIMMEITHNHSSKTKNIDNAQSITGASIADGENINNLLALEFASCSADVGHYVGHMTQN